MVGKFFQILNWIQEYQEIRHENAFYGKEEEDLTFKFT